jgi:hypothetical protein
LGWECELPPNFGKSASQYMQELKESMEIVAGYAEDHTAKGKQNTPIITIYGQKINISKSGTKLLF